MSSAARRATAVVLVLIVGVAAAFALGGDDEQQEPAAAPATTEAPSGGPPAHAGGGKGGGPPDGRGGGPPADRPAATPTTPQKRPPERANLDGVAPPTKIEDSGTKAARAVEAEIGVADGVEPTVIGSTCSEGRCVVRYRARPRGGGSNLNDQAKIISRLFADESTRSVVLYVHHKVNGKGHDERAAFMTLRCRRGAVSDARWAKVAGVELERLCDVTHVAGGKQRSGIDSGELSVDDASRGRGG